MADIFQTLFSDGIYTNENVCILIKILQKFVLKGPNCQWVSIDLGDGLVPNKWQAITWTNVDQDIWCHMASLLCLLELI